jgi:hypothetical protein
MRSIRLAAGFVALAVVGCGSSLKTDTDFDRETSFANLHTYDWVSEEKKRSAPNPETERQITRAVESELAARGFQMGSNDPDFRVGFVVLVTDEVTDQTMVTDSVLGYVSMRRYAETYVDGSLVLFMEEPGGQKVIWRGVAEKGFEQGASREEVNKAIDKAVKQLLSDFPPKK